MSEKFTNEYLSLYPVSPISHLWLSSARAEIILRWAAWYMNDNEDDGITIKFNIHYLMLADCKRIRYRGAS